MPSAEFQEAAVRVKKLSKEPSSTEMLELYGLFKQVTEGDNTKPKPSGFANLGEAGYKYEAWKKVTDRGLSQEDAEKEYIAKVDELVEKYGLRE